MANSDKNIVITPNIGSTTDDPKIVFTGASSSLGPQTITLKIYPTSNGTLSLEGSAGQLFSVTNSMTGTIYSVNDVSGIPSIEVLDTGVVKLAQYSGNVGIYSANPVNKLQIGSVGSSNYAGNHFAIGDGTYAYAEYLNGSSYMAYYTTSGFFYFANQYLQAAGSMRAPIFYDSNDTGYYIDPNSTADNALRIRGGALFGPNSTWSAYLYVGSNGNVSGTATITTTDGNIHIDPSDTSHGIYLGYYTGDYTRIYNSVRAPIFYDLDNTGYYVNPADYSYMYSIGAASYVYGGYLRSGTNVSTDQNYGYGLVGTYSSYRYQGVFAMGDSYKLPADGTTTGNLYGMAWSHPNAGGTASNLNSHGLLLLQNGSFMSALSTNGTFSADVRGTIFYDYNNTGYYVDPSDTSRVVSHIIGAHGGTAYDTATSGSLWLGTNSSSGYRIYTHMENYNGYYSKLTLDWHTGIKIGAYYNYGGIRFYNNSIDGGGSKVFSIAEGDSHVRVVNNLYAPIMYDLDSTSYYIDPASTSNLNDVRAYTGLTVSGGAGNGYGINLYSGSPASPTYGLFFAQTGTFGTHGSVTADWATYFTMNSTANRGWIFRQVESPINVASINNSGTAVFNGNVTAYSDIRVKKNITVIENALAKVKELRGVTFDRTDDVNLPRQTGVIAQEVIKVLPEAVLGDEESHYSVAYGNLVGLLIEAIKELNDKIESLQNKE